MSNTVLKVTEIYPKEVVHSEIINPDYSSSVMCGACGTVNKRIFDAGRKPGDEYVVECTNKNDVGQQCQNKFKVSYSMKD